MNKITKFLVYCGGIISTLAVVLGRISAARACSVWLYQPKVPEEMLRKKEW
ncbi:cyclic lactone autoinducer peptide [Clostridiales bacterium FE2011]|nr:cyclic lactone autoinducer peptide [Clostridiales bacterium FE2011]QTE75643.1 cyclic lactone autoinducer peptide [Clostridiales bacterium FE2010]